jgi:glycosyltransferase involved in cell wall biosynthesis
MTEAPELALIRRKHPRLAALYEADPGRWRSRLIALAPTLAGWPDAPAARPGTAARLPRPAPGAAAPPPRPAPPVASDAPVRCGFLSSGLQVGGAELWMATLARHATESVRWMGVATPAAGQSDPAAVAWFPPGFPVAEGAPAARDLAARCEVVFAWGQDPFDLLPPGTRVVLVAHGTGEWTRAAMARADRAAATAAVSGGAAGSFPEPVRPRVEVVPNGIDPARVAHAPGDRARLRAGWGVPAGRRVALYLGRLSPEKGYRRFLDAAAESERRWPGAVAWVLCGGGWKDAEARAYGAAVAPHAVWAGRRMEVGPVLAAADVLVNTSHEEACSLAILEAFHAGVPVLATRAGIFLGTDAFDGLARVVPQSAGGAEVALALAELARDGAGRSAMVARARQAATTTFALGAMVAAYERIAWRVARRPRVGGAPPRPEPGELVRSLTDAQRATIESCSHHKLVERCCGEADVCDLGRIRSNATRTEDCARCLLNSMER